MIIGAFLRYFKTYQGINYIPITDEDQFCGLVGNNGVGKSSVLESLDTFFNSRPWNFNTVTKKSGMSSTKPQIIPVFLMNKSIFKGDILEKAEILNRISLSTKESDVTPSLKSHAKSFAEHRDRLLERVALDDLLLLPIGIDYEGKVSISLFNNRLIVEELFGDDCDAGRNSLTEEEIKAFMPLLEAIRNKIEYIYT